MTRLRRAVAGTLWYAREVMGENAYEHYLAHQRRHHPAEPVGAGRDRSGGSGEPGDGS